MTTYYLHDGAYHELAQDAKLPKGAKAVPRLPELGETWDRGAFVNDPEMAVRLNQNEAAVVEAHILKQLEATIIMSGVQLTHGLLAEEAVATGMQIQDLAAQVHSNSQSVRALEVDRRVALAAARREK